MKTMIQRLDDEHKCQYIEHEHDNGIKDVEKAKVLRLLLRLQDAASKSKRGIISKQLLTRAVKRSF